MDGLVKVIFKVSFDLPHGHTSLTNVFNVVHGENIYFFEPYHFAEIAFKPYQ